MNSIKNVLQYITKGEVIMSDDIVMAQKIISGFYHDIYSYHENSFIYKFTNEYINCYKNYLQNKEKILTVTSSGDHIFNAILCGSKNITSFDISRFPKYFFELKKAAILSLSKNEFLDFFTNETVYDNILNYNIFCKIKNNLDKDSYYFWTNLFNFYEGGELYNSSLFSRELVTPSIVIQRNPYLEDNNYKKLQKQLETVNINHIKGNIVDLNKNLEDDFDLILLSSIIYYGFGEIENYKKLLSELKLKENGIAISYLYKLKDNLINQFQDNNFIFEKFKSNDDGILIYKK